MGDNYEWEKPVSPRANFLFRIPPTEKGIPFLVSYIAIGGLGLEVATMTYC